MNVPALAYLNSWEATTSVGESALETEILWRAGISNVALSRFIDAQGDRVRMCFSPAVPADVLGVERMARLADLALGRLQRSLLDKRHQPSRPALLVALPERFDAPAGEPPSAQVETLLKALRACLAPPWQGATIEPFPFGRAGGALALQRASLLLEEGRAVIWGGVDSQYDWSVLEALAKADRLLGVDNVDGVRPGEGAAFVLLERPGRGQGGLSVLGFGVGQERHPVGHETPSMALGLTHALDAALDPLRRTGRRSNYWLLDNTHEVYATQQLQNIITRFSDVIGLEAVLHTPLKDLGDVGAAAIPLLAVLAAQAWNLGHTDDDVMVLTGCSDGGARGAVLLAGSDSFNQGEAR